MNKTNSKKKESLQHVCVNCRNDKISLNGSKGCINIYFNLHLSQSVCSITLEDFKSMFVKNLSRIAPYISFNKYYDEVCEAIKDCISNCENFQLYTVIGNPSDLNSNLTVTSTYIYKIV